MRWRTEALRLGILVFVIALIVAFSDTRAILATVRRAGLAVMAFAVILVLMAMTLNAAKWRLILPGVRLATLLYISLISAFYAYFFLGQASGEAARMYILSRASGNTGGAVMSVMADRLTSSIGLLIVSIVGFVLSPSPYPPNLQLLSLVGLIILIVLLLVLRHAAAFSLAERFVVRLEARESRIKGVVKLLRQAIEQWHTSSRTGILVVNAIAMGGLVHFANTLVVFVLARAIGVDVAFFDWCWIVGIMSVAGLVPLTVGQVTSHGTMVALLHFLGVTLEDALSVAVLVLSVSLVIALFGGALEWHRLHKTSSMR